MKTVKNLFSIITNSANLVNRAISNIEDIPEFEDRYPHLLLKLKDIKKELDSAELVDAQRREDMIVGALEGGSNYWYFLGDKEMDIIVKYSVKTTANNSIAEMMFRALVAGETIQIHDTEDREGEKIGQINLESIRKGEFLMMENFPEHFADILNETDDSITADIWFQLASLGDNVYT